MFSTIGLMLDKTRLGFKKGRFKELERLYGKIMSKIGLLFVLLIVFLIAILWVWHQGVNPPPAKFYMVTSSQSEISDFELENAIEESSVEDQHYNNSMVHELSTTRSPRMSTLKMQKWLTRSLMDVYTFNFTNYEEVLDDMKWVFRPDTHESFISQLNQRRGIIPTVAENRLVVSLVPTSEVRVVKVGRNGKYRLWMVEMHAVIYFSGAIAEGTQHRPVLFKVLVEEVDPIRNPYGLVISQIRQS